MTNKSTPSFLGGSEDRPATASPGLRLGRRWPVGVQIFAPMAFVVLLACLLATLITSYWLAARVRREQSEDLQRVVGTLTESTYPLTKSVLLQMRGLSGAEFVVQSGDGQVLESSLPDAVVALRRMFEFARPGPQVVPVVVGDRRYLVDVVSLSGRPGAPEGSILFVLFPEELLTSRIYAAVYPAIIAGTAASVIALLVARWLTTRLLRPMHSIVEKTASIATGDFEPMRLPNRNDELRDLAESINRMAAQLKNYGNQVRQSERLRTLGQIGGAMAHQLRNAAAGGRFAVELHQRDCPSCARDESLGVALRQFQRMESYLRRFLAIRRTPLDLREAVDVRSIVVEAITLVRPMAEHAGLEIDLMPNASPMLVRGDAESLRELTTNLLMNAVEAAMPNAAGRGRVSVEIAHQSSGGCIRIRDNGPGPSPDVRELLFGPFVTGKPDGVGLGLYVAREIAEIHSGRLVWERTDGVTVFTFEFPIDNGNGHGPHSDR